MMAERSAAMLVVLRVVAWVAPKVSTMVDLMAAQSDDAKAVVKDDWLAVVMAVLRVDLMVENLANARMTVSALRRKY